MVTEKKDCKGEAPVEAAADDFLVWQEEHIAAPRHNLVVSTVYALTTHYKDTVHAMPKLVFYATMNTSGKTTAARAVMEAGNFAPKARKATKLTAAAIVRLADGTKQGVIIDDAHRFAPWDGIFNFVVNSFPRDGMHIVSNNKKQTELVEYEIGGTPVVITTNAVGKLDQDAVRRSILLPMIRRKPKKRVPKRAADYEQALFPIWDAFDNSVRYGNGPALVEAQLDADMPAWMGEDQQDRWAPLFAVCRALLGARWVGMLEDAARHLEDVTYTPNATQQLLTAIWEVKEDNPDTIGILPGTLYGKLKERHADVWGDLSDVKLAGLVKEIRDADGRKLERQNIPAQSPVVGTHQPGAKYYPWRHFEAAWEAYGIGKRRLRLVS